MTEILLKGRKTLTHPSIHFVGLYFIFRDTVYEVPAILLVLTWGGSYTLIYMYKPRHEKTCLMVYVNNTGADQPAKFENIYRKCDTNEDAGMTTVGLVLHTGELGS